MWNENHWGREKENEECSLRICNSQCTVYNACDILVHVEEMTFRANCYDDKNAFACKAGAFVIDKHEAQWVRVKGKGKRGYLKLDLIFAVFAKLKMTRTSCCRQHHLDYFFSNWKVWQNQRNHWALYVDVQYVHWQLYKSHILIEHLSQWLRI